MNNIKSLIGCAEEHSKLLDSNNDQDKDFISNQKSEKAFYKDLKTISLVNTPNQKEVEAIDNISKLIVDISSMISKYNYTMFFDEMEEINTFSLLDKLKTSELVRINQGLAGWKNHDDILAPCYKPSYPEINALYNFIHNNKNVNVNIVKHIAENKARVSNFQKFIIYGKTTPINEVSFIEETKTFLNELKAGIKTLDKIFKCTGLSKQEIKLFHMFCARTSSVLFYLGFPDSINHSAQVARKSIIDAYRSKLSRAEILQTAIVSWIHDPKLPGYYSWSNLSTHPVIASAIALDILTQQEFYREIEQYLCDVPCKKMTAEKFAKGIIEAVAINNDSKFVLDNAIFNRPSWATGIPESGGIIDQISSMDSKQLLQKGIKFDSNTLIHNITNIALDRFYAPSVKKKPAAFNSYLISILKTIQIETGIIGIHTKHFEDIISGLSCELAFLNTNNTVEVFEEIISGNIESPEVLLKIHSQLNNLLKEEDDAIISIKVPADKLFSHHDEMKYAPYSAFNLAIADRLLLSPHKILEAGIQNTALGRLVSFMDSFEDNINTLPVIARQGGKIFQRDLYVSILKTADILTNKDNYQKFKTLSTGMIEKYQPYKTVASCDINSKVLDNQLDYLRYLIKEESTWVNYSNNIDYGNIDPANKDDREHFNILLKQIQLQYGKVIEKSPEMFGFINLNRFSIFDRVLNKL
jgi:hypothetical protein